jgi:phenylacetate-CoA ligase
LVEKKYWDPETETMPLKDLQRIQLKRLRHVVGYVYEKVPFYHQKFNQMGLKPSDIRSLSDISKIPLTTKEDIRQNFPFKMFAVPLPELCEIHASSGTTGTPSVVGYTKQDLETWRHVMARSMYAAGVRKSDFIQLAYGFGLFTGGFGFFHGAQEIGAAVVPTGAGNTLRQLKIMREIGSTVLACTPTYAAYMGEIAQQEGLDLLNEVKIRLGLFGAEPWSDHLRSKIEDVWNMQAIDNYGLSEIIGPGVSVECTEQDGLHMWVDHFYPEIIDSETHESLDLEEEGELVLTTLTKEGIPLLRYRTRDMVSFYSEICACGRTMPKHSRIVGRSDDMLVVGGANCYPSTLELALMSVPGVSTNYQIILYSDKSLDRMKFLVEPTPNKWNSKELDNMAENIRREVLTVVGIGVNVELVESGSLPRFEGKATRVIDQRKK